MLDNRVVENLAVLEHVRQAGDPAVDPEFFEQGSTLVPRVRHHGVAVNSEQVERDERHGNRAVGYLESIAP